MPEQEFTPDATLPVNDQPASSDAAAPEEKPFFVLPDTHGAQTFKTPDELSDFLRNKTGLTENFTRAQERAAQEKRTLEAQLVETQRNLKAYADYYQQQAAKTAAPAINATEDGMETLGITVEHVNKLHADNAALRREIQETKQAISEMQQSGRLRDVQSEFNTALGRNSALMSMMNHKDPEKRAMAELLTTSIAAEWQSGKGRQAGYSLDEIVKEKVAIVAGYEHGSNRAYLDVAAKRAGGAMPSLPGGVGITPPITDEQLAKADRKIGDMGEPSEKQFLLGKRAIDAFRARRA